VDAALDRAVTPRGGLKRHLPTTLDPPGSEEIGRQYER